MLNIKVLGPGCANCFTLERLTITALEYMAEDETNEMDQQDVTLEHLTQREDFRRYNLMFTPGLVINEQLVCAGRLPSMLEIQEWLAAALQQDAAE